MLLIGLVETQYFASPAMQVAEQRINLPCIVRDAKYCVSTILCDAKAYAETRVNRISPQKVQQGCQ